jgi:hypothetical protein
MSLARHAAVLWRFRGVVACGVLLGIVLAILASYKVGSGGLTPRGSETWSSESALLVTQPGFPEGRVVLPTGNEPDAAEAGSRPAAPAKSGKGGKGDDEILFADPNRFLFLADFYTQLAGSDEVRERIPQKHARNQIQVSLVPGTAGTAVLPIIKLSTTASTGAGAQALNVGMTKALRDELAAEQGANGIPAGERVQLTEFNAPSAPALVSGRSHTASILALLLALIGSVAVAHILAALRPGRESAPDEFVELFPWHAGMGPEPPAEPVVNGDAAHTADADMAGHRSPPRR